MSFSCLSFWTKWQSCLERRMFPFVYTCLSRDLKLGKMSVKPPSYLYYFQNKIYDSWKWSDNETQNERNQKYTLFSKIGPHHQTKGTVFTSSVALIARGIEGEFELFTLWSASQSLEKRDSNSKLGVQSCKNIVWRRLFKRRDHLCPFVCLSPLSREHETPNCSVFIRSSERTCSGDTNLEKVSFLPHPTSWSSEM